MTSRYRLDQRLMINFFYQLQIGKLKINYLSIIQYIGKHEIRPQSFIYELKANMCEAKLY